MIDMSELIDFVVSKCAENLEHGKVNLDKALAYSTVYKYVTGEDLLWKTIDESRKRQNAEMIASIQSLNACQLN